MTGGPPRHPESDGEIPSNSCAAFSWSLWGCPGGAGSVEEASASRAECLFLVGESLRQSKWRSEAIICCGSRSFVCFFFMWTKRCLAFAFFLNLLHLTLCRRQLGRPDKAQLAISWGIDLDPKASSDVKYGKGSAEDIPEDLPDGEEIDRLLGLSGMVVWEEWERKEIK